MHLEIVIWNGNDAPPLECPMRLTSFSRLLACTVLLGTLACATSSAGLARHQSQRLAEMDQLDLQAGMPEAWQTPNVKAMRAFHRKGNPTAQRLSGTLE